MPTVQRHTERTATSLKSGSITAAEANRIFGPHAISSAQLGTIIGGTIDADTKIRPHAFGSAQLGTIIPTVAETRIFAPHMIGSESLGTIIGGTIDADTKVAPHAFGSAQLGTLVPTIAEERIFAPHTLSSASLGTIIGGTIDADTKIAPHSFGSAELGTIFPTEAETERMIVAKTIDRDALSYLIQSGSAFLGTTRYTAFPTAFTDVPSVTITPVGSTDLAAIVGMAGSAYIHGLHSVDVGSFQSYATPSQYFMWIAQGSA